MPASGLQGWSRDDLEYFLFCHNFVIVKSKRGSHNVWLNRHTLKTAEVHELHHNSSYKMPTLIAIIQQMGYTEQYARGWRAMNKSQQKQVAKRIKKEQC